MQISGATSQRDFRPPTLRRLHLASGGNPFFALEIARTILLQGEPPAGAPLPVPENLHELVRRRLARLPSAAREALTAAALLSDPTVDLVAPSRPDVLAVAVAAAVILVEGSHIRFSHPLIASTLVAEASTDSKRQIHRRLAAAVVAWNAVARLVRRILLGEGDARQHKGERNHSNG